VEMKADIDVNHGSLEMNKDGILSVQENIVEIDE